MFTLPELPYAEDALAPYISARTLELHHGTHHKSYVDTLNTLLTGDKLAGLSLESVILASHASPIRQPIFNNAAQIWNHDFFWKSMRPDGGGNPTGPLKARIADDIGDAKAFGTAFKQAAAMHFGSGWVWLVVTNDVVRIVTTHDAGLPLVSGETALLCCDLWEHAYYLDYQSKRADFVTAFLEHLVNWDFANENFARATLNIHKENSKALEPNDPSFVFPKS